MIQDKSLAATKQNLVKNNFPYIDTFDYKGPSVVRTMRDLTRGVFGHLEITSLPGVDKRVNYMQRLLRVLALKKYNTILAGCKETTRGIAGYQ